MGGLNSTTGTIVMFVLLIIIFYLFLIRPETQKRKKMNEMRNNLKVGDEITTIGGVIGTICHITEKRIVIETGADRVRVEITRWAVNTNETADRERRPTKNSGSIKSADSKKKGSVMAKPSPFKPGEEPKAEAPEIEEVVEETVEKTEE